MNVHSPEASAKVPPMRTCIGCRQVMPQKDLVRLAVLEEAPHVVPDARGKLGGRGAWIEPKRACFDRAARKGGFQRALKRSAHVDVDGTIDLVRSQLERRLWSLVGGGFRARKIVFGTDQVRESIHSRRSHVLGVAEDAAGRRAQLEGQAERVAIYGSKTTLGEAFGRDEVGVYSIEDEGIGAEVLRVTAHLAGLRSMDDFTYDDGGEQGRAAGDR